MDKITPLERELLKSVETFVNGMKRELRSLQTGVSNDLNNYEERLQTVEERLMNIEKTLTNVVNPLTKQLASFQIQLKQLAEQLNRLNL